MLALLAAQRLWELRKSAHNERWLAQHGAREHAPQQVVLMKWLHGAWFVSMLIEVWWLERPFIPPLFVWALLTAMIGQGLRYAAIRSLGRRWTVRVLTLPNAPLIRTGIYRWLRHPNYLGVTLEIAAIPLMHTAFITSAVFAALHAVFRTWRIRAEEQALGGRAGQMLGRAVG